MLVTLSSYWWLFVFRGILGIMFGVSALIYSSVSITTLLYFSAAFVLVEGSFMTVASLDFRKENKGWWIYRLFGIAGVALGGLTLFNPDATTTWLYALAAGWSLGIGIMGIISTVRLRKEMRSEWSLSLGSALSFLFGIYLLSRPEGAALSMQWAIGLFALIFGLMLLTFGIRIKKQAVKVAKELVNAIR